MDVARCVRVTGGCFASGDAVVVAAAAVAATVVADVVASTVAVLPLRALPALSGRSRGVLPTELPVITTVVGTVVGAACTGDGAERFGVVVPDVFPGDDSVLGRREGLALTIACPLRANSLGDVGVNAEPSSSQSSSPMLKRRRLLWPWGLGSAEGGAATMVAVVALVVVVYTAGVLMAAWDRVNGGRVALAAAVVAAGGGIGVIASSMGLAADDDAGCG